MDSFCHVIQIDDEKTLGYIRQEAVPNLTGQDGQPYYLVKIVIPMQEGTRWAEAYYETQGGQ